MNLRRVWTMGEGLAALVSPGPGPAEHACTLNVGAGGAELNVAIGLARLGHPVTWVGVVGDDPWGKRICRDLRAEGVDVHARVVSETFTAAYLREQRTATLVRATYLRRGAAGSLMNRADARVIAPVPGDIVHLTGVTPALSGSAREAWLCAAQQAHGSKAHLSLDVNYRSALTTPEDAVLAFNAIAPYVHTLMASIDEAEIVTGKRLPTATKAAAALSAVLGRPADIVIKNGADGSLHFDAGGSVTEGKAFDVTVADLVGAGDAFAAGYLSGVLDQRPVAERLGRAHACAAFVVSSIGDWEGAPRRAELQFTSTFATKEIHR
jgi:2-dehydro-3-deoxygluconokinase